MFQVTTALRKISGMKKRIRAIKGGQGAGKTIAILVLIINSCGYKGGRDWIIASEELTVMKDSVIKDFLKVLQWLNVWEEHRWNKSDFIYTFSNGSSIKFRPLSKDDRGKGVRCYGFYCNEVNKVTFEAFHQFASRAKLVIADWNPDAPFFMEDEVIPRADCELLQLTFRDNEALDITEKKEILLYQKRGYKNLKLPRGKGIGRRYHKDNIKNKFWANKWQVYGLGNVGALMGVVFENWDIVQDIPAEARLRSGGGDFGFTNDPSCMVSVYEWNGYKVLDEEFYETGMQNDDIAREWKKTVLANKTVYWDSAEPKSIATLRKKHKLRAVGADKGGDSVRHGMDLMQANKYLITERSKNLISNFRHHKWATDRNGKPTNEPENKHKHGIDAVRYEELGKNKNSGKYTVK